MDTCEYLRYSSEPLYDETGTKERRLIAIPYCIYGKEEKTIENLEDICIYPAKMCAFKELLELEALYSQIIPIEDIKNTEVKNG